MDALDAIAARRSWRSFKTDGVPRGALEKIADAGRLAATARNVQPWEFVVVTQRDTLERLGKTADHGPFLAQAGACVAVFCKETKYFLEDGAAATQNMLVAATALGLGSCWVAGDKKGYAPAVAELLKVPAGLRLISLIALGYPEGPAKNPPKRPLGETLHWEHY